LLEFQSAWQIVEKGYESHKIEKYYLNMRRRLC